VRQAQRQQQFVVVLVVVLVVVALVINFGDGSITGRTDQHDTARPDTA
jgi:hypothetical protein